MASIDHILAEENPSRAMYRPDGTAAEIALVPSSMLVELVSKTVALVGTIEKLSVDLVAINPSVVDCVRLQKRVLIRALTSRELEVLSWMAQGISNSAIAERLGISGKTVERHIHNIYQSLQLDHVNDVCPRVLAVLEYVNYILGSPTNNGMDLHGKHERVAKT